MTVFDDGNLRHTQCGHRQQPRHGSVRHPSDTHTVYIQTMADMGQYSFALGSAQLLSRAVDPVYASFGNGLLFLPVDAAQTTETDLSGNLVFEMQTNEWSYRTYRAQDLYTPTLP